jgi:Zn-dependent protease
MLILSYLSAGNYAGLLSMIVALVVGLTVHEYAHARVAFALGDLTAYMQGRLTLDPRRHLDPFGALMFLLVGFGWARPVPIDPYRLGRSGTLKVAIAGPLSNVAMAAVAGLPVRFLGLASAPGAAGFVGEFLADFAWFNILLAVFNMLPIPPLDGWKVLMGLVPPNLADRLARFEPYGFLVLLGLILVGNMAGFSVLWAVMGPFVSLLTRVILGTAPIQA